MPLASGRTLRVTRALSDHVMADLRYASLALADLVRKRAPPDKPGLIEGAAQLLLVHRSSSDERADSALADTCVSSLCRSGSGAYRDTRFHGEAKL
jgi:hypothetical protein